MRSLEQVNTQNRISGHRLSVAKILLGMTNAQFSEFLNHEPSGHYMSQIFSGYKRMSEDRIRKVAKATGYRYEWLAGFDDWQTEEDRLRDPAVIADAQKVILYQMGIEPASMSDKDRAFLFQMMIKMGRVIAEDLTAKK